MPLTLGTAGHIDHGKTALIRALTGTDTDRLPEERERGISIALGYARLELPSGRALSVVDVPGHERFVRTMVAGATGVDLYLLVIAADDGVMPQTREHLRVLKALGVDTGVVAVTKCDLAPPPELDFDHVVPVSVRTGEGLDTLRGALDAAASSLRGCHSNPHATSVLHIDRVFTIRGAGTVVTGTLWSGRIAKGDVVTLLPSGRTVRVRGVQVHDDAVESAGAGQRVALNLAGVDHDEVARGDVVTTGGAGGPTSRYVVDARLDHEPPARVMVHHGTRETAARATRRGDRWRLSCEQPLIVRDGDRLVIRSIAPPDTLGGGIVLPAPSPSVPAVEAPKPPAPQSDGKVRVGRERWEAATVDELRAKVVALLEAEGEASLARVRDELGLGRKDTQALLEHLDAERVTIRRGEARTLRRRRQPEAP